MKTEEIREELDGLEFELSISDYWNDGDPMSILEENIMDAIRCEEIIYYSSAINFLKENDPSLNESIALACGMGFELSGINSELLATLLHQDQLIQEWHEIRDEVEQIINQ